MKALHSIALPGAVAFLLVASTGCKHQEQQAPKPPTVSITVAHPIIRDVSQWDEFNGRLESVETVVVKAHVSGYVTSVPFVEGTVVKQGQVLATIDPRPFQAQLDSAKADELTSEAKLQLAQAALQLAQNDVKRLESVMNNGVVTDQEIDTKRAEVAQAVATVNQARAGIAAAKAAVDLANQSVEWCVVTAPITGRLSDRKITPGNFLTGGSGNDTTVITTIKSLDPIYATVDADEASVQKYLKLAREKKRASAADSTIACYMGIDDEDGFPHVGYIDFLDNNINPATATRRARGIFPNADGLLLPGFHARLRVVGQEYKKAMLVLDQAIGTDQDRKFIFILKQGDSKTPPALERRLINVGPLLGELRVIETGVAPEDLVVVNGGINVRPGWSLMPMTETMPEHSLPPDDTAGPRAPVAASQPADQPATRTEAAQ